MFTMKAYLKSLDDNSKEVELTVGRTTLGRGALLNVSIAHLSITVTQSPTLLRIVLCLCLNPIITYFKCLFVVISFVPHLDINCHYNNNVFDSVLRQESVPKSRLH